ISESNTRLCTSCLATCSHVPTPPPPLFTGVVREAAAAIFWSIRRDDAAVFLLLGCNNDINVTGIPLYTMALACSGILHFVKNDIIYRRNSDENRKNIKNDRQISGAGPGSFSGLAGSSEGKDSDDAGGQSAGRIQRGTDHSDSQRRQGNEDIYQLQSAQKAVEERQIFKAARLR